MKKILFALLMACTMTLGMAVTAFGTDEATDDPYNLTEDTTISDPDIITDEATDDPYSLTEDTRISAPTITVSVPTDYHIVINPYGMKVDYEDRLGATDPILSATQYISSETASALSVSVTIAGTIPDGSGVWFVDSTPDPTEKELFLWFEMKNTTDEGVEPIWDTAYDRTKHIAVGTRAATMENMLTLGAGNETKTWAAFRLTGEVSNASEIPWTEADTVRIVVTFTFTPILTTTGGSN